MFLKVQVQVGLVNYIKVKSTHDKKHHLFDLLQYYFIYLLNFGIVVYEGRVFRVFRVVNHMPVIIFLNIQCVRGSDRGTGVCPYLAEGLDTPSYSYSQSDLIKRTEKRDRRLFELFLEVRCTACSLSS
jgi:hypothetical protein